MSKIFRADITFIFFSVVECKRFLEKPSKLLHLVLERKDTKKWFCCGECTEEILSGGSNGVFKKIHSPWAANQ